MKGCMATGIFPQTRKEEAAIAVVTKTKAVDGMVIQRDILKHQEEVGKAAEAVSEAAREGADARDMRRMITTATAVAGGMVALKDAIREKAITKAVVAIVTMTTTKIMMKMIIAEAAEALAVGRADGLVIRKDTPKHQAEVGDARVEETMMNTKRTMTGIMITQTNTKMKTKIAIADVEEAAGRRADVRQADADLLA